VGDCENGRDESAGTRCRAALPVCAASVAGFLAIPLIVVAGLATGQAQQILPATAEAKLCAASGEQILAGNVVRFAVYQEEFSRYSPRQGRCYVEMRVQTIASDAQADRIGRFLYDGQSKELLAFAQIRDGKKSGRVFDLNHHTTTFDNGGWDDASDYIYRMMADDW
jgi:hypothetical protein